MSRITIIWSVASGACLMLALLNLLVWLQDRRSWAHLCFSVTVLGVVGLAVFEWMTMHAESPEAFGWALRWAHLDYALVVTGSLGFVHFHFGTGRRWLLALALGGRMLAVVANFTTGLNLHVSAIHSLHQITFLGEQVSVLGEWVPNPWVRLGQLATLAQLVYVVDASIRLWREGSPESRKRALFIGGTLAFFVVFVAVQPGLVAAGMLRMPFIVSFPFLGMLSVMGYELGRDVLRAAHLARDLAENQKHMTLAAEATHLGIWVRDLGSGEIWASDQWRALFGFAPAERLELASILQRMHPDDRETAHRTLADALARGGGYQTEYRLVLPDGRTRWIASSGRVEFNGDGKPAFMRGVSLDDTARKLAEQEMLLLRQELAHVDRVSTMGHLASALAHELNQPLGAILRNAEAAELFMQHESPDLDEIRAILSDIRKDNQRASAVIDRMRALMRRHALETQALDVAEFIGDVTALTRSDAAVRRVKVKVLVPPDLPPVRGDRVHLQQVLLNLIINGMDAVSETAEEDRCITLCARRDGGEVIEIAVSDSGSGIPADKLANIFDHFFTTKTHGMGMGLAISRTIIEAHGGRLWAENNVGRGATFRFTLQIAQDTAS
jgi:two-component system sensor kinase FixL